MRISEYPHLGDIRAFSLTLALAGTCKCFERFVQTSGVKMLPLMLKALTCNCLNCLIVTKSLLPWQE